MNEPSAENSDAFLDLMDNAVGRIVATEDFDTVLAWMREPGCLHEMVPPESAEGAEKAAATMITRSLWNATPLPGNR